MNSTTNKKGPAEAATSPDQGPINLLRGNYMNTQASNTALAEAARATHYVVAANDLEGAQRNLNHLINVIAHFQFDGENGEWCDSLLWIARDLSDAILDAELGERRVA